MSSQNAGEQPIKSFHFIEGKPTRPKADDKENAHAHAHERLSPTKSPIARRASNDAVNEDSEPKPPPSTPGTRLPLADLLGDNEEGKGFQSRPNVSPQDQISWVPSKSPSSSRTKQTPTTKGKKRAHSSSPPTASQRSAIKRAKQKAALDLKELKSSLRSTQADTTADLWNRYNGGLNKDTPLGQRLTSLASGLGSSSPYTSEDRAGNVSGLRRWTSCGMEFPASKPKRQKIQHTRDVTSMGQVFHEASTKAPTVAKGSSKSIRIGSLLDKISENLEVSRAIAEEEQAPSSSSPLPERPEDFDRQSISPLRAPELAKANSSSTKRSNNLLRSDYKDGCVREESRSPQSEKNEHSSGTLGEEHYSGLDRQVQSTDQQGSRSANRPIEEPDLVNEDDFSDSFELSEDELESVARACEPVAQLIVQEDQHDSNQISIAKGSSTPDDDYGDDIGDDIDEDLFAAAEASATQFHSTAGRSRSSRRRKHRTIQRYRVIDVFEGSYVAETGQQQYEKVLSVEDEKTGMVKAIILRDSWFDTRCSSGSYVHVIGEFNHLGQCFITDSDSMLILHPDHLVSALAVADSFSCMRKAVLQDRIKATSESSPPMLYGTVLHEIFQEAMKASRWDGDWLEELIDTLLARHIEELYQNNLNIDAARAHLRTKIPELQAWAEVFVKAKNESMGTVKDRNGKLVKMNVNKLLDVEEHIWSPMYGLKGNIDATVEVSMMESEDGGDKPRTLVVPLELKTGKRENASHRAQTALYTLLLSDRYDVAVAYGILYYIETSQVLRIPAIRHELRHMVMQRNELACYVRERLALPPMLRDTHLCNRCYAKQPCFLYHKLIENGDGDTSGLRDKFDVLTKHLNTTHQSFFKKWNDLLTKEETEIMKFRRELWTMLSHERERLGRCFANVSLIRESASEDLGSSRINRFSYAFNKQTDLGDFSFSESQIAVGDPIVISDERGHYALAIGYVTALTNLQVTVAVDRRLHNARLRQSGFDEVTNQVFAGINDGATPAASPSTPASTSPDNLLYRIDKDEFSSGMALVRAHLVSIMAHDVPHASKIRSLVVDNAPPSFRSQSTNYTLTGPASQLNVNEDQRIAIEKILSAEDYALVLGMPGTGKTTTIAHIIRALVAKGKSVLLASYTHSAVDNILLKLRDDKISLLRLGALAKIHSDVKDFAQLAAEPRETVEELKTLYHDPQVVATTCLGVNHNIFNERTFDYCIVDEASQITLPVCLGPIRMARSFVLVGDHYQLPPLVQNKDALDGGLDVSLFRMLCEQRPEAVVTLGVQYRMNESIMRLSNELVYDGKLRCGDSGVANRRMKLSNHRKIEGIHDALTSHSTGNICKAQTSSSCWLHRAIAPSRPVIFLNTDCVPPNYHETATGARIANALEAKLVVHFVTALITAGVPAPSIGIMTFYRSQLALLRSSLTSSPLPSWTVQQIEAHTADRFQGRDKEVVVLSCVRSNDHGVVGELLKDWRRVNVALTRAKSKLLIVGSRQTLGNDEILKKMVGLCEIVDVPENGWLHDFGSISTVSPTKQLVEDRKERKPLSEKTPASMNTIATPGSKNTAKGIKQSQLLKPGQKPFKVPAKVGKVVRSDKVARKQAGPVLEDVMREVLGA